MLDPLDFENRPTIDKLQRRRLAALAVILLERVSLHGWRIFFWILFFSGLWLLQFPGLFGQAGGIVTLILFAGGLSYLAGLDLPGFRLPSATDIDRRLEQESGLPHRPVSELTDKLANPEKNTTRSLWAEARKSMLRAIGNLKAPKPKALIAARDPYAIRLAVTLFFVISLFLAGAQWDERLLRGLAPFNFKFLERPADDITVWITPPEYTGAPQIVLTGGKQDKDILQIPTGSEIKVRVTGGPGRPVFMIDDQKIKLNHLDGDSYGHEMVMPAGDSFSVRQMLITRAKWHYKLLSDAAPTIAVKDDFEVLENQQLRFPLTVYDDYGVRDITMHLVLDEMITDKPMGQPVTETRSVISPSKTQFDIQPVYDLTAHPWAGLPVTVQLIVSDHQNQTSQVEPIKLTLPERVFRHPVAKKLIEQRKKLVWSPLESGPDVGYQLLQLLKRPGAFQDDIVVFLALRTAASRLYYSPGEESAKALIALLWDTALRIEDGNLPLAARNLRDAQMALEKALENPDITDEEIAALMDDLRAAMAEYLMELQAEVQKRAESGEIPILPPEMLSQTLDPNALSQFFDQMESEMLSGSRKNAQEMLSQLQRMLDMMEPSMSAALPDDMQFMADGISEIQELIERQQQLLDQTRGQAEVLGFMQNNTQSFGNILPLEQQQMLKQWGLEDMPPPPEKPSATPPVVINTQANKAQQEALRYVLGQLMIEAAEKLGDIPEPMGLAEYEMRGSSEALGENHPDISIPHQEKALEYLQQSMKQMSEQLMARLQKMTGMALSGGMRLDPLGRPYGGDGDRPGLFPGARVKIPDEAQQKRVDEILKLLRRRSGELNRPEEELEYFRRLLRQF